MAKPLAYAPEQGYMFQILVKCPNVKAYEHCDYAVDIHDKKHLLDNYREAYGAGFKFKTLMLPKKYWKKNEETSV